MRSLPVVVGMVAVVAVGAAGAIAHGEPCDEGAPCKHPAASWYELGMQWFRLDHDATPTTVTARRLSGMAVSFSPRLAFTPHLYVAGEVAFGTLSDDAGVPGGTLARSDSSELPPALSGTYGAAGVALGTHAIVGAVSCAAEAAAMLRTASVTSTNGLGSDMQDDYALEGRGRIDLWLSRHTTLGAVAAIDLRRHDDVTFGVAFGFHFAAYDRQR